MRLLDRLLIGAALLAVLALASGRAAAQIYRWVDERGTVHYTQGLHNGPEGYRSRAQQITFPEPAPLR